MLIYKLKSKRVENGKMDYLEEPGEFIGKLLRQIKSCSFIPLLNIGDHQVQLTQTIELNEKD